MRYWWVNHKQTHKQEIEGGYIWSPQKDKSGKPRVSYSNLERVTPRDLIVSFADGQVKAVGVAMSPARDCERPTEFEQNPVASAWSDEGWIVDVEWECLAHPFRTKAFAQRFAPYLPEKHAPIRESGAGAQNVYLGEISEQLFHAVIETARELNNVIGLQSNQTLNSLDEEEATREIIDSARKGYEKDQLVKARRGQGVFRARLEKVEEGCRFTAIKDSRFLTASHIKPWRLSSDTEKVDGNNGLLLAPHLDRLFDGGWISIDHEGRILVANESIKEVLAAWAIDLDLRLGKFNDTQAAYLAFHRENILKST